jgi:hypothetical protein
MSTSVNQHGLTESGLWGATEILSSFPFTLCVTRTLQRPFTTYASHKTFALLCHDNKYKAERHISRWQVIFSALHISALPQT